jgi:predicted alpha/beta superfamily hydrolase
MATLQLPSGLGTLTRHEKFPSRLVPPRHVDIWCPPGYADFTGMVYPVIYMHDGQNLFLPEASYGKIPWGMDLAMSGLISAGKTPGAIIVGIWNAGADRWREYLPQRPAETPQGRAFAALYPDRLPAAVYSDLYLRFLVEELKPFVDAHYRALPEQAFTFVMGSSMGGLVSLYAACEYPQVFGGAGCLSTHWLAGEQFMVDYLGGNLPKPADHRLYFDFGTRALDADYEPFQRRMDGHLRKAGYAAGRNWLTMKFDGADHSEQSWRERVHVPLEFLLG